MALSAYRNLYRAAKVAFEGDATVLSAAKVQIRQGFREKAALPASDPSVEPAIRHAEEVAAFLRTNLVQGRRIADSTYKLRIHEDTELGDNDSIKTSNDGLTVELGANSCSNR